MAAEDCRGANGLTAAAHNDVDNACLSRVSVGESRFWINEPAFNGELACHRRVPAGVLVAPECLYFKQLSSVVFEIMYVHMYSLVHCTRVRTMVPWYHGTEYHGKGTGYVWPYNIISKTTCTYVPARTMVPWYVPWYHGTNGTYVSESCDITL